MVPLLQWVFDKLEKILKITVSKIVAPQMRIGWDISQKPTRIAVHNLGKYSDLMFLFLVRLDDPQNS